MRQTLPLQLRRSRQPGTFRPLVHAHRINHVGRYARFLRNAVREKGTQVSGMFTALSLAQFFQHFLIHDVSSAG